MQLLRWLLSALGEELEEEFGGDLRLRRKTLWWTARWDLALRRLSGFDRRAFGAFSLMTHFRELVEER